MLIPMKEYIRTKKDALKVGSACAFIIILISLIIFTIMLTINTDINKIELPTVYVARHFGEIYQLLYGIVILGAIITTAISSAYGFLNNASKTEIKYKKYNKLICLIAIFISGIGFSNLVNSLYPIFGILGLMQLIFIIKSK